MKDFWQKLPKPFFALAPMEDVTDSVFRQVVGWCSKPDVYFTEFTSVDGICSIGRDRVMHRLQFTQAERPIIAQLWGLIPQNYYTVAKMVVAMGFDGIDINMGCPERVVAKRGACAALIKNPTLAAEIIKATQAGAGNLPVSVKTRIGFTKIATDEWIGFLLKQNLDALTVHGRTAKEMSLVPAHWDEIAKTVTLRDKINPRTIILGNGDVADCADGNKKVKQYGVDGVMIGRGIFKNLWAFDHSFVIPTGVEESDTNQGYKPVVVDPSTHARDDRSLLQMLTLLRRHMQLYVNTWGSKKNFLVLRRFFKIYVSGFPGASNLREKLMKTKSSADVEAILAQLS